MRPLRQLFLCLAIAAAGALSLRCVEFNAECSPIVSDPEKVSGYLDGDVGITKPEARTKNNAIGQLVAEAYYSAFGEISPKSLPDIGMVNSGGIRSEGNVCGEIPTLKKGPVKRKRLRDVLAFDNAVVSLTVTHKQLKNILEHSVAAFTKSGQGSPSGAFLQLFGAEIAVDCSQQNETLKPDGTRDREGKRITRITLIKRGGERVDLPLNPPSETEKVRLAVDSFLQQGLDNYKDFLAINPDDTISVGSLNFETVAQYFEKTYPKDAPYPAKAKTAVVLTDDCR